MKRFIRYLLIFIFFFCFYSFNVDAKSQPMNAYLNGTLWQGEPFYDGGRNNTVRIESTQLVADLTLTPSYGYVQFCSYSPITSWYSSDETYLKNEFFHDTGVPCKAPGWSIYGTVRYLTFDTPSWNCSVQGINCYFNQSVTFYQEAKSHYYFMSSGFTDEPIEIDMSSGAIINQNQQIIDKITSQISQNIQIITQNDKTNEELGELNDSVSSEDDDVTSKKCGMICKLKGIFTGIIELPGKLVNLLIDALKSLFVPTDEQLYEIINDSKELSENFGFVGESVSFFIDIFTALLGMVNANGCIELAEMTIGATSLFDSYTFWEAQQVCLADNVILSENIDTIRTITSIVLVSLFINFASSKFFNILSKSDNDQARTDSYDIR